MSLTLKRPAEGRALNLSFISINDFGGQVPYRASLTERDTSNATRVGKTAGIPQ
jgi:hypothetical protein